MLRYPEPYGFRYLAIAFLSRQLDRSGYQGLSLESSWYTGAVTQKALFSLCRKVRATGAPLVEAGQQRCHKWRFMTSMSKDIGTLLLKGHHADECLCRRAAEGTVGEVRPQWALGHKVFRHRWSALSYLRWLTAKTVECTRQQHRQARASIWGEVCEIRVGLLGERSWRGMRGATNLGRAVARSPWLITEMRSFSGSCRCSWHWTHGYAQRIRGVQT